VILEGRVWKYAQQVRATDLVPARYDYIKLTDWTECSTHVLEDLDPDFRANVQPGDLIVGGQGFGAGHAHYFQQAFEGPRWLGVGGYLAESFDPIFLLSALGAGMPCWNVPGILDFVNGADRISCDLATGTIVNHTAGTVAQFRPVAPEVIEVLEVGGLDQLTVRRLGLGAKA
jgi:3-isopropylmalate/(R)-2-methylmalate dehydratase small subunit